MPDLCRGDLRNLQTFGLSSKPYLAWNMVLGGLNLRPGTR